MSHVVVVVVVWRDDSRCEDVFDSSGALVAFLNSATPGGAAPVG